MAREPVETRGPAEATGGAWRNGARSLGRVNSGEGRGDGPGNDAVSVPERAYGWAPGLASLGA